MQPAERPRQTGCIPIDSDASVNENVLGGGWRRESAVINFIRASERAAKFFHQRENDICFLLN
jgi:hypothetical protein